MFGKISDYEKFEYVLDTYKQFALWVVICKKCGYIQSSLLEKEFFKPKKRRTVLDNIFGLNKSKKLRCEYCLSEGSIVGIDPHNYEIFMRIESRTRKIDTILT